MYLCMCVFGGGKILSVTSIYSVSLIQIIMGPPSFVQECGSVGRHSRKVKIIREVLGTGVYGLRELPRIWTLLTEVMTYASLEGAEGTGN